MLQNFIENGNGSNQHDQRVKKPSKTGGHEL